MFERSRMGEPPTEFERELIAEADPAEVAELPWQWVALAQRFGLEPILAVMDAFAGEQDVVMSRRRLFDVLSQPQADRIIAARYQRREPVAQIAADLGVSRRRIYRSLRRLGVKPHTENAVKAAG